MKDGLFFRNGFDLEIYVLEFNYMTGDSDILDDSIYDFIYSQNLYLGSVLKIHRFA